MAKGLDSERRQIEAEEVKLKQRRERLLEMERAEVVKRLAKSPITKLNLDQLDQLMAAMKTLGIAEVLRRLA